mmetsp:Transcript_68753/g.201338  ORF Transcript_68753/g.201338 Transcript_68753/m.201338 type:complete len:201 (-) Transcript_68753:205-807(-)
MLSTRATTTTRAATAGAVDDHLVAFPARLAERGHARELDCDFAPGERGMQRHQDTTQRWQQCEQPSGRSRLWHTRNSCCPRVVPGRPLRQLKPSLPSYHCRNRSEKSSPTVYSYSIWMAMQPAAARRRSAAATSAEATPVPCAERSTTMRPQWPQPQQVKGGWIVEEQQPTSSSPCQARCITRLAQVPESPMATRSRTSC